LNAPWQGFTWLRHSLRLMLVGRVNVVHLHLLVLTPTSRLEPREGYA
jgi:hypothetical protein